MLPQVWLLLEAVPGRQPAGQCDGVGDTGVFPTRVLQECKMRTLLLPRLQVDPLSNLCPSLGNRNKDGAIPAVTSQDPCKENTREEQRQRMGVSRGSFSPGPPRCGFPWDIH